MSTMQLSDKGRHYLEQREGCKLHVYLDVRGLATIGYGHLIKAGEHFSVLTQGEADALFAKDLALYVNAVNNSITAPVSQDQFDAMVSLCYNIGIGGFEHSTVLREFNAGDIDFAASAFLMWNKPTAILGRREEEKEQFEGKI